MLCVSHALCEQRRLGAFSTVDSAHETGNGEQDP